LHDDEADILDADTCEMISEALQQQVEPFVIKWACGDDRPLAYISIQPASCPNVDQDVKVDEFLTRSGVQLSRREVLQRYGRTAYDPDDPDDMPVGAPARLAGASQPPGAVFTTSSAKPSPGSTAPWLRPNTPSAERVNTKTPVSCSSPTSTFPGRKGANE